jgi:hypothetical protein
MTPRRKDSGSNLALGITIHGQCSHEVRMRFLLFDGRPSMPASIPSYHMYLATTFEVIGWWGGVGWRRCWRAGRERGDDDHG